MQEKNPKSRNRKQQATEVHSEIIALIVWPAVALVAGYYVMAGWFQIAPGLIVVLTAITGVSEAYKTQLGALTERAFRSKQYARGVGFAFGAFICIVWGAASGVAVIYANAAPARAYQEAIAVSSLASRELQAVNERIAALPSPTPSMPKVRIDAMRADNAEAMKRLGPLQAEAKKKADTAAAVLQKTKKPPMGDIPWWIELLISGFVEVLFFIVPWCNTVPNAKAAAVKPVQSEPESVKVNDGGWAARRAKYGPKGRKPKLKVVRTA